MKRYFLSVAMVVLGAAGAQASTLFNFGSGAGINSTYPGNSAAGASTTGVALTSPLLLDLGELQITAQGGALDCDLGATAGTCGYTAALTSANAYGLGVGSGRLTGTNTITLTLNNPNYIVSLVSFSLTGFTGAEAATYSVDGGTATTVNPLGTAFETYTVNQAFTNSIVFGVGNGNFSLAQIVLNITPTPEPATAGLVGLALAGLGLFSRRRRKA